jgi:hypothetical protein
MSNRLNPAAALFLQSAPSSAGAQPTRPLAVAPQPKEADTLPEKYGVPALELLVVDPANVFISWEIADIQLDSAKAEMGELFDRRKLCLDIQIADESPELLVRIELFGEVGRWFISLPPVGRAIRASLYFDSEGKKYLLRDAGPVVLPRISAVEPESFVELHVAYSLGPGGRLSLAGISRSVPKVSPEFGVDTTQQAYPGSGQTGVAGSSQQWSGAWRGHGSGNLGARDD